MGGSAKAYHYGQLRGNADLLLVVTPSTAIRVRHWYEPIKSGLQVRHTAVPGSGVKPSFSSIAFRL
jgi:hypothetical protein